MSQYGGFPVIFPLKPTKRGSKTRSHTVDGRNPAPPNPGMMIPLSIPTNNGFNHGFQVVRNAFRPSTAPTSENPHPRIPFFFARPLVPSLHPPAANGSSSRNFDAASSHSPRSSAGSLETLGGKMPARSRRRKQPGVSL